MNPTMFDVFCMLLDTCDPKKFKVSFHCSTVHSCLYSVSNFPDDKRKPYFKYWITIKRKDSSKAPAWEKSFDLVECEDGSAVQVNGGPYCPHRIPKIIYHSTLERIASRVCWTFSIGQWVSVKKGSLLCLTCREGRFLVCVYKFTVPLKKSFFFGRNQEISYTISGINESNEEILLDYLAEKIPEISEDIHCIF